MALFGYLEKSKVNWMLQLNIIVIVIAFRVVVGDQAIDDGIFTCDELIRLNSNGEKLCSLARSGGQVTVNEAYKEIANSTSREESDNEAYISGGWFRMGLEKEIVFGDGEAPLLDVEVCVHGMPSSYTRQGETTLPRDFLHFSLKREK